MNETPLQAPVVVWFRKDLRLEDNPALVAATQTGRPVLPLYVLDSDHPEACPSGAASAVWLHHSLKNLSESLSGNLVLRKGASEDILQDIVRTTGAQAVFWNRARHPSGMEIDDRIARIIRTARVRVETFQSASLYEPESVTKPDGTPYRIFAPFYKTCLRLGEPPEPLSAPVVLPLYAERTSESLDSLGLLPKIRWDRDLVAHWTIGERGAQADLQAFLEVGLTRYATDRDRPDKPYVSRLSPRLAHGELSPRQVWHAVRVSAHLTRDHRGVESFLRELLWREFSSALLWHFPDLPDKPLRPEFADFPWTDNPDFLERWQKGTTGIPIVDAGMRQLWQTGWMHNRVRMLTASFLAKHLLVDWRHGERWFRDCLVDADIASNAANWQWVAGCGTDAAPYFRIFNPLLQARKFDPEGAYVRRYGPESSSEPIVDLSENRKAALDAYKTRINKYT